MIGVANRPEWAALGAVPRTAVPRSSGSTSLIFERPMSMSLQSLVTRHCERIPGEKICGINSWTAKKSLARRPKGSQQLTAPRQDLQLGLQLGASAGKAGLLV